MSRIYNTSIKEKKAHYGKFVELIKNQFWHGGEKYALDENKEFTDAICECFPGESGTDWILGTCMKYLGRFKNFRREKDLLKVATYMYIIWLKHGFHLEEKHDEDISVSGKGDENVQKDSKDSSNSGVCDATRFAGSGRLHG